MSDYESAFNDGLAAAVMLARAGASVDEIAALIPNDPGQMDPRKYSDHLTTLRAILGTDALFEG